MSKKKDNPAPEPTSEPTNAPTGTPANGQPHDAPDESAPAEDAPSAPDPVKSAPRNPWASGAHDGGAAPNPKASPWLPPEAGGRPLSGRFGGSGGGSGGKSGGGPRLPGSFDEILARSPFGGNGAGLPGGRSIWAWGAAALVGLWIATTSVHQLDPEEEGVVTRLGSYSRTVGSGVSWTLPSPIEHMIKLPVREVQAETIPGGTGQNLVLTGDANIINLAYTVRWTIKDPELFQFQDENPRATIRDAAESAMRATVANFTLEQAITSGKQDIAVQVQQRLQAILDRYAIGVRIEGIAISDSAPPAEVEDAFSKVQAARQEAESYANQARGYAQQVRNRAEGDAAQFDRLYAEYRLAPEVTRRRIYYETMERVLGPAQKTIVSGNGVSPYMALPEVRRRAQPATPAPPAAAPASSATPAGAPQ